jgi:uncharacterized protein (DUF1786 family)
LAIDIGAGTEDILLFDSQKKSIENCVKMVLPSPSLIFSEEVEKSIKKKRDLLIIGSTIGGGSLTSILKKHIENGFKVLMTEKSAYSIRNNLDEVRELGIQVIKKEDQSDFSGEVLFSKEVNIRQINSFLKDVGESLIDVDVVALAVQDHGVSPIGLSNRKFRIQTLKEKLERNRRIDSLAFKREEIPSYFLRMISAAQDSKSQLPTAEVLVMDTAPSALLGCLKDREVETEESILAVNVGNSHIIAAIIRDGMVTAMMEHHTSLLDSKRLEEILIKFANGKITDYEIFENNGHGLFYLSKQTNIRELDIIAATGPNRDLLSMTSLPIHFAAPAGDMMMTGPIGLIEAAKIKFGLNINKE